jgi:transcriptional regulator with XRE-family HTH domain
MKRKSSEPDFDVGARLKQIRKVKNYTQRQLAVRAQVPHGQIAMIERNRSSPSVASLRRILSGIPMTMAEFFEPQRAPPASTQHVFRPKDLQDLTSRLSASRRRSNPGLLALQQVGDARAHNLQILHEMYEPGADTGESMLEHDASEGGIIISGEIELTVANEITILRAGDAFLFNSRLPHRFRNNGRTRAVVVSACTPPYL